MNDMESRIKEMAKHTFGTWNWQKAWKAPMLITDAEGVYFYDANGKSYLDFSSQLMCSNSGAQKQGDLRSHCPTGPTIAVYRTGFHH